ncbi:MAG TPA: type II secretion system protein GspE [Gammaproteobacteria bacterium]|nr:type II secretion system protein GspE [Gammaproteobacteria bacterium]
MSEPASRIEPLQEAPPIQEEELQRPLQLPFPFARRHGALITGSGEGMVNVLCREDVSPLVLAEVRRFAGAPLHLERVDSERFEQVLQQLYESGSGEAMLQMDGLDEEMDLASVAQQLSEPEDLLESEDDAPIIRLINALFTEAVKVDASDIHIEPFERRLRVRFRVDGVLRDVLQPNRALAPLLVSRIKVMAKLDIAEKRIPQDGRISLRIAGRAVDVRVSTLPSGNGERVVMRLLDKQAGRLDLEHLGMPTATREELDRLIHRPHGILLVTGPTGSGKTTTLYAAVTRLNTSSRNILTVEDPIEYYLDGIGQTQVNTKVDMSFARGLRAILRQDPDVVMVGEIRDLETAEIAVQASLTGHLVLSTLHTNTAVGAVTRLRDMGVESFLLASSVVGVLAQRLVRGLCPHCREAHRASEAECLQLGVSPASPPTIYRPRGCKRCNQQGYVGRRGLYELVVFDEQMRALIHENVNEQQLEEHARSRSPSLRAQGMQAVLEGLTSLEEVLRVTEEE